MGDNESPDFDKGSLYERTNQIGDFADFHRKSVAMGDEGNDFDHFIKREDCDTFTWAFIVTANGFQRRYENAPDVPLIKIDGRWSLATLMTAEVLLTPWTQAEDRVGHYEACQRISFALGRAVFPAWLAEDVK